jgi:hypothetical protein
MPRIGRDGFFFERPDCLAPMSLPSGELYKRIRPMSSFGRVA